ESALFGDLTLHFTDRFEVQVGGRETQIRQRYDETDVGPVVRLFFGFPSPLFEPTEHSKESAFTYLLTPRLKISTDLMVYARLASGYRGGGPNPAASLFNLPRTFDPDKCNDF